MTTAAAAPASPTLADLLERLGGIDPARVLSVPPPGTATEDDVLRVEAREGRLCELIDGVLVEKTIGFLESCLAVAIAALLRDFVIPRNLGVVAGADGTIRLFPALVLIPDVCFVSWDRLPGRAIPKAPIPDLVPDLVVEVLSRSNTQGEMDRKRREYFGAGVRLAWFVDPASRTVAVFRSPDDSTPLDASDRLDGGDVLPGLAQPVSDLFAEADRAAP